MSEDNIYESPEADNPDVLNHRRIRRTLVYLKQMHDDPSGYKRRLNFRGVFYLITAIVALLLMQWREDVNIDFIGILCLVLFSMFMHMAQLCRLANSSLDLNMAIIDWAKVEKLLEEQDAESEET